MCPDKSILSAYFDGEVDVQWSVEISRHLENCQQCSSYLSELKDQRDLLQSLPFPDFTESLDKIKTRLREKETVSGSTRFWEKRISFPAAAAAAIIAATVSLGANYITSDKTGSPQFANLSDENYTSEVVNLPGNKIEELFSMMESSLSDEFSSNSIVSLPANVNLTFSGDSQLVRSAGYTGSSAP